jgi:hypothetical protein
MDNLPKDIIRLIVNNSLALAPILSAISKDLYETTHTVLPILRSWRLHVLAYRLSFMKYLIAFGADDILAKIDLLPCHLRLATKYGNISAIFRLIYRYNWSTYSCLYSSLDQKILYNEDIIRNILIDRMDNNTTLYDDLSSRQREYIKNYKLYGTWRKRPEHEPEEIRLLKILNR